MSVMNGERRPLLIEIGCEEIPARMIARGVADLAAALAGLLATARLGHGEVRAWGGSRRFAVHIAAVEARQQDRDETLLGPPAAIAFDESGRPTRAAIGFAKKQGLDAQSLERLETAKGAYAGVRRSVAGRGLGEVLAERLPAAVSGIGFPKTMRWLDGQYRWVRPVHWVVALHGAEVLPLQLFGVAAGRRSRTHRYLGPGSVVVPDAERYHEALREGFVVADPAERRKLLETRLREAANEAGGVLIDDDALLDEIADLVEWPDVVRGAFDERYLELPRELLVTTLRHHQKCFSVRAAEGDRLRPAFLAVANTDRDPQGHIRRGNEWVIGGRLEDARFFWSEDMKVPFDRHESALERVVFHAKAGSYADKVARVAKLAAAIAERIGCGAEDVRRAAAAGARCKHDLVTGVVGEFPELQGVMGGLLYEAQGGDAAIARAIYEHYLPAGQADPLPAQPLGRVLSVADKLDTIATLTGAGVIPSGSRDPLGLRRAANGCLRVALESGWPLSIEELAGLAGDSGGGAPSGFLAERLERFLRDAGHSANEIRSVFESEGPATRRPLSDLVARLTAVRGVRGRAEFAALVELTKRTANILRNNAERVRTVEAQGGHVDPEPAVRALEERLAELSPRLEAASGAARYEEVLDGLAGLAAPVHTFFEDALVIDPDDAAATDHRLGLLVRLHGQLTRYFDISQLAGEAGERI